MDTPPATEYPENIAVIHDWLVTFGGAEVVLEQILSALPNSDLFGIVERLTAANRQRLKSDKIFTSYVQRLPFARTNYWYYSLLMPLAVEQFNLGQYDMIFSSSHAFAKGVIVSPDQLHICYCHSPMRFAWDLQNYYLDKFGWQRGFRRLMASLAFHYLRGWDVRSSQSVDVLLCNSNFVARRIRKLYGRLALVVAPPIDTARFVPGGSRGPHYLTGSFMNPFKGLDVIVEAFSQMPAKQLVVFGDGPAATALKRRATPNVSFVGRLSDEELVARLQTARALVYAAPEDFGMLMAEAQACGTPVIAYGVGGAGEIVRATGAQRTGVLYWQQTPEAVRQAVGAFEEIEEAILPEACRDNVLRFDTAHFRRRIRSITETAWRLWSSHRWPDHDSALIAALAPDGRAIF